MITNRKIQKWNACDTPLFFPSTIRSAKIYYPGNMFDEMITVDFEGQKFMSVARYDEILRLEYGDYMQLPPEEERVYTHHPVLVDFGRNFEEIPKEEN